MLNLSLLSGLAPVIMSAPIVYKPLWENQTAKQKWVPVQGCSGCDNWFDLSLGKAWLLAIVIILQGSCYFTVLAHFFAARLSRDAGLQRPLPDSPRVKSWVQFICQAGPVNPPSHSHALAASSTAFSAQLSITHLLSSAASHTRLPGLLCPISCPFSC